MAIKLVVGLGNPGPKYQETRHNAGAWLIHAIVAGLGQTLREESKFQGSIAKCSERGHDFLALLPSTYMNESGKSVVAVAKFYKIMPEEILIAHDELDLEPGVARLKEGGGHGGHNGLRSIISHLHSKEFVRARIGIGHPGHKDQVTDYVLKRPAKQEQTLIEDAVNDFHRVIPEIISGDYQAAMRTLHQ